MDLEDLAPNLRPDADRSTKRGKAPANKDRIEKSKMAGGQRGANTMAMRFRKAPITLPAISIQKRED